MTEQKERFQEQNVASTESDVQASTNSKNDQSEETQPRYLVGVNYEDRAERNRAEYRLDNWNGEVKQLPGMARMVQGEGFYELYNELQEAVDDLDHLYVYELQSIASTSTEVTARIDRVFDVKIDRIEWCVGSLLEKRQTTRKSDNEYQIRSPKSDTTVSFEYHITSARDGSRLEITLTGPSPAPNALKEGMLRDIGYMLPEPDEVYDQ